MKIKVSKFLVVNLETDLYYPRSTPAFNISMVESHFKSNNLYIFDLGYFFLERRSTYIQYFVMLKHKMFIMMCICIYKATYIL